MFFGYCSLIKFIIRFLTNVCLNCRICLIILPFHHIKLCIYSFNILVVRHAQIGITNNSYLIGTRFLLLSLSFQLIRKKRSISAYLLSVIMNILFFGRFNIYTLIDWFYSLCTFLYHKSNLYLDYS